MRLLFRTMNTSHCVPAIYIKHHAYHQSAYTCTAVSVLPDVVMIRIVLTWWFATSTDL